MPPATRDGALGFLGVNLRRDPLNMADGDVVRAINADFHVQPGTFRRRLGRVRLGQKLYGAPITLIGRHNSLRYVVADANLYQGADLVLAGLTGDVTTLFAYQPVNDTAVWTFVANTGLSPLQKVRSTLVYRWGLLAPETTPVLGIAAAGALTGDYAAIYTYARLTGTAVAHESNPTPLPTAVTLAAENLTIDVIASLDPQVDAIRIYRTLANGALYFFDQSVANTTATITLSQDDLSLGVACEFDNDPPPVLGWAAAFQQHIFLCNEPELLPNTLYYSKRFRPESWPTDQYLLLGLPSDPLQCAIPMAGMLGVFSRDTKYRVFGNAISGFTALEALSTRGTLAPQAVLATSLGVVFPARDGLWATNFAERDTELTQMLSPLFYGEAVNGYAPIDLAHPELLALCEYRRRFYFAYRDTAGVSMIAVYSQDTQRWYHYQLDATALYWDERPDLLLMGALDGSLYTGEEGASDGGTAIALEVMLPAKGSGDRFSRKQYRYLRADIDAQDETVWLDIYVDSVLRTTLAVTGVRSRALRRLPPALLGTSWQVLVRSTGTAPVTIYAIDLLAQPLEYA